MPIIFATPEASAIIAKDKQVAKRLKEEQEDEDEYLGFTLDKLAERLRQTEREIEDLEMELNGLAETQDKLRAKILIAKQGNHPINPALQPPLHPHLGLNAAVDGPWWLSESMKLRRWNKWVSGKRA